MVEGISEEEEQRTRHRLRSSIDLDDGGGHAILYNCRKLFAISSISVASRSSAPHPRGQDSGKFQGFQANCVKTLFADMEMENGLEMNAAPMLTNGRHGFGMRSGDLEYQGSSSHGSAKRSRVEEGEIWHGASTSEHQPWRMPFPGESSQMQGIPGFQRPKRQNFTSSSLAHWDPMHGAPRIFDETGAGSSWTGMGGTEGRSFRLGVSGISTTNVVDLGLRSVGFDSLGTNFTIPESSSNSSTFSFLPSWAASGESLPSLGANLLEDKMGCWSGAVDLHSVGSRLEGMRSGATFHLDGASLEERRTGDMILNPPENVLGTGFLSDRQNSEFQASLRGNFSEPSGRAETRYLRTTMNQGPHNMEGSCGLDPSMPFSGGSLVGSSMDNAGRSRLGHVNSGRRGSCKRKSPADGVTAPMAFEAPESFGRRESNYARLNGGLGPGRHDLGTSNCGSAAVNVPHAASAAPTIRIWDHPYNVRADLVNHEGGTSHRNGYSRSITMQQEQIQSQLHTRNVRRSAPASQSRGWLSRTAEQPLEPNANMASNSTTVREAEHWSASAFNQRSGANSVMANWGGNNLFPRSSSNHSSFSATTRERTSIGAPSWLGASAMENRLPSQTGLDPSSRSVISSTSRPMNAPENYSHHSQIGASSVLYPGSASWSAPHLSAMLSTRRNSASQVHMLPPSTLSTSSSHPVAGTLAASLEVVPYSAAIYQRPGPSAMHSSLFVDGHGEGVLVSPVQSLFGMPFHGVQIVPAEGENHHQFVSEELVMLEPSMIFDGSDVHDQHSDLRLDVDNMSYEELLALEERIGNVSTGLSEETIAKCLKISKYSSLDATGAAVFQESEVKCSICQEEYVEEDELGRLDCGHSYHTPCIKQWLVQKNQCPICKATANSKS